MRISTRKCVDDDYDDSGGRTQRNCLTLAAPDRRPSQTEAKTNTVCICKQFLVENLASKGPPMKNLVCNEKFGINCASAEGQFGTGRGII